MAARNATKCYLNNLPLELVAEVLSYTPSTRDVLAVARTSKTFCATLVNNPATAFIWRQARARDTIPDPPPGMSEPTFAALLFDPGLCEICGRKTHVGYLSFALRARTCNGTTCCVRALQLYMITERDEEDYHDIIQWIPHLERSDGKLFSFYAGRTCVRQSSWTQAIDERSKAYTLGPDAISAYTETKQVLADALPAKIEAYKKLITWRDARERLRKTWNDELGPATADMHASQIECTKWEILQSETYAIIYHAKLRCYEKWLQPEFDAMKDTVLAEVETNRQRKKTREHDLELNGKRTHVDKEYARLRHEDPKAVMPSLPEFRHLSVVKTIVESPSAKNARLGDPLVASILQDQLKQWADAARAALAAILGFSGWRTMSKKKLHPVVRLTARFRCKRCDAAGKDTGIGLDFARACEHICSSTNKKTHKKRRWDPGNFIADQQSIDAVSQVLELCGTKPENADSLAIADSVGDRVQCDSCSLNMDVRSVARHRKRHEACAFTLLPEWGESDERILEHGLTAKLMKMATASQTPRDRKIYACRHCKSIPTDHQMQHERRLKLMSFDGLRSHLKEKHRVVSVGDEDFLCQNRSASSTNDP
ncbi:hypothetical protein BC628DRAFT_1456205 [Trametes gibbosa]|nr:hypothetical protein BC628DRAFT_1456205 [Trametes gibbosa]